jgi:hypothetical protein
MLWQKSQYHLRERVDHRLNAPVDLWIHPLTQVVLTSSLRSVLNAESARDTHPPPGRP